MTYDCVARPYGVWVGCEAGDAERTADQSSCTTPERGCVQRPTAQCLGDLRRGGMVGWMAARRRVWPHTRRNRRREWVCQGSTLTVAGTKPPARSSHGRR